MKMFHWEIAECLRLYSSGDIIVMAETLEEAKTVALEAGKTAVLGYANMAETAAWITQYPDDTDEQERFDGLMALLKKDLEKAPVVYAAPAAVFVNGGE